MSTQALNPPLDIVLDRAYAGPTPKSRPGKGKRLVTFIGDAAILMAIAFSLPFVIIAVALPVVLVVQLVSWIARLM